MSDVIVVEKAYLVGELVPTPFDFLKSSKICFKQKTF